MKRCPQCNSVFPDSLIYCTNDGSALNLETFVMPSEASPPEPEEITIIRREPVTSDPITIDIPNPNPPPIPVEQLNYQTPPTENIIPVIIEKPRNTGKYILFLVLGLILGGGLVLAAILFSMYLSQRDAPQNADTTNRNSTTATPTASKTTPTPVTASAKHEKPTDAPDDDFNGRVITLNAYVRSQPSRNSKETDVLPIDDRLDIEERASDNSPWFRVTCEHGTSGWMHGNTIEYTK